MSVYMYFRVSTLDWISCNDVWSNERFVCASNLSIGYKTTYYQRRAIKPPSDISTHDGWCVRAIAALCITSTKCPLYLGEPAYNRPIWSTVLLAARFGTILVCLAARRQADPLINSSNNLLLVRLIRSAALFLRRCDSPPFFRLTWFYLMSTPLHRGAILVDGWTQFQLNATHDLCTMVGINLRTTKDQ